MADVIQELEEQFQHHFEKARSFLKESDFISAREEIEMALEVKPGDDRALNLLGMIYFKIEDYEKAVKIFRQLLRRNPNINTLRINLGLAFLKLGEYEDAVSVLKEAIMLDETNEKAHNYLGYALYNLGELQKALEEFKKGNAEKMIKKIESELSGEEKIEAIENHEAGIDQGLEELPSPDGNEGEPVTPVEASIPKEEVEPQQVDETPPEEESEKKVSSEESEPGVETEQTQPGNQEHNVDDTALASEKTDQGEEPIKEKEFIDNFKPLSETLIEEESTPSEVEQAPPDTADTEKEEEIKKELEHKAEESPSPENSYEAETQPPAEVEDSSVQANQVKNDESTSQQEAIASEITDEKEHPEEATIDASKVEEETGSEVKDVEKEEKMPPETEEDFSTAKIEKVHTFKNGNLDIKIIDRAFCIRTNNILVMKGNIDIQELNKKYRNKVLKSVFGSRRNPIGKVFGTGSISVEFGRNEPPFEIEIRGEELFTAEDFVFGFSDTLEYENGKLVKGEREVNMVRFFKYGYVLFSLVQSDIIKMENVDPEEPVLVPLERIVGWKGKFIPTVVSEGTKLFISLKGTGFLYLKR